MCNKSDSSWDENWLHCETTAWPEYTQLRIEWFRKKCMELREKNEIQNSVVVEVGAGAGWVTRELYSIFNDCTYYCTDISTVALEKIDKLQLPNVKTINSLTLAAKGMKADIIVCGDVIEHVKDRKAFLPFINSITRPRGYLLLSTPNRYMPSVYLNLLLGREASPQPYDRPLSMEELKGLIKSYDFEIIECIYKSAPTQQVIHYKSFLKKIVREALVRMITCYLVLKRTSMQHSIMMLAQYIPMASRIKSE